MNTEKCINEAKGNAVLHGVSSRFIVITYLFYIVFYEGMILGGCAYVVFFLNRSGWWFLLAVLLSGAAYSPAKWHRLLTSKIDKDEQS
jgi:hypothetical protein